MTKKKSAKERRLEQLAKKKRERQRNYFIAGLVGIAILALFVAIRQLNAPSPEDVTIPDSLDPPPNVDGKAWGAVDAPVKLEEFSDFQCPFCRRFSETVGIQLKEDYADSGLVRFEYNHFAFIGAESDKAAEAAECANEQNSFWQYHDTLFANQRGENLGAFRDAALKNFAAAIGLNESEFNDCFDAQRYEDAVVADTEYGVELGVNSTPSLFLNGERVENPNDYSLVQSLVEAALGNGR